MTGALRERWIFPDNSPPLEPVRRHHHPEKTKIVYCKDVNR